MIRITPSGIPELPVHIKGSALTIPWEVRKLDAFPEVGISGAIN
jgi:hypothetical protein